MKIKAADLRRELIDATSTWGADTKPENPGDVFILTSHMNALALNRPLVIGMRGAGKSFWSEVLCNETLRASLTKKIDGYDKLTAVYPIRWDQGITGNLPESSTLRQALEQGVSPKILWSGLFLRKLQAEFQQRGIPTGIPEGKEKWLDTFLWARGDPEVISAGLAKLESALVAENRRVLIVIDALDLMAGQLNEGIAFLRGLLEFLRDARHLKGLKFKVFLREDMSNLSSVLSFPDSSKLINEAPRLEWSREDIYALHFLKLAQKSPYFQKLIEERFGPSRQSNPYLHAVLTDYAPTTKKQGGDLAVVLKLLAPPYMGKAANKGHVYSWWHTHLADGRGRVSPRTFSASMASALRNTVGTLGASEHALTAKAIQQGLREASDKRVAELKEDYFWIEAALAAFKGRPTPVTGREIYNVWNGAGAGEERTPVPKVIREQCQAQGVLAPWDDKNLTISPSQSLRDTLVDLGILTLRNEGTRLDMPDIYRLGYKISKHGGVPTRR